MNRKGAGKHFFLLLLSLLSVCLGCIYLFQAKDFPLFTHLTLDPEFYDSVAQKILSGDLSSEQLLYGSVLYPYFLAFFYWIFGHSLFVVFFMHIFLHALSCVLIFHLAKKIFGKPCAYSSAILFCFYDILIFYQGILVSETLAVFLVLLVLNLLLRGRDDKRFHFWVFTGIIFGLLTLSRSNYAFFYPGAVFWIVVYFFRKIPVKKIIFIVFALSLGLFFVLGLTIWRNYSIAGDFIPLSAHGGMVLYIGTNPQARGIYEGHPYFGDTPLQQIRDAKRIAEVETQSILKPSEVSRFWVGKVCEFVFSDPLRFFWLIGRKIHVLLNTFEAADVSDYYFFKQYIPLFRFPLVSSIFVFPLALAGIVFVLIQRKFSGTVLLLFLYLSLYGGTLLLLTVNARFRLPLLPVFVIFAAYAIIFLGRMIRNGKVKDSCMGFALICLFFVFTNQRIILKTFEREYNDLGAIYLENGNITQAFDCYRQSLRLYPKSALTLHNLGVIYFRTGNYVQGISYLLDALQSNPRYQEAYITLGKMHEQLGIYALAEQYFRQAAEQNPYAQEIRLLLEKAAVWAKTGIPASRRGAKSEIYRALAELYRSRGLVSEAEYLRLQAKVVQSEKQEELFSTTE